MNTSHNYADFIGMSITSNDDYEPYGYQQEVETAHDSDYGSMESRIENMLLNHSKYHIYCE